MQSNNTQPEHPSKAPPEVTELVALMVRHNLVVKPRTDDGPDMYSAARALLAREHRKTLEARLDEALFQRYNRPATDPGDEWIAARIGELQSQLPKKERME